MSDVTAVRVYQWALPEDTAPLREAAHRLATANVDVVLFTTSVQVAHLMQVAAEEGVADGVRAGFQDVVVASIGPTTTEALEEYGIAPDITPTGLNFNTVTNYPNHVKFMADLVAAAVICGKSRAVTMDLIDNGGGNSLTWQS